MINVYINQLRIFKLKFKITKTILYSYERGVRTVNSTIVQTYLKQYNCYANIIIQNEMQIGIHIQRKIKN